MTLASAATAAASVATAIKAGSATVVPKPSKKANATSQNKLYLLDTATGELWFWTFGDWQKMDTPVQPRSRAKGKRQAELPVKLELPRNGALMPMEQRERRFVPGSEKSIEVVLRS